MPIGGTHTRRQRHREATAPLIVIGAWPSTRRRTGPWSGSGLGPWGVVARWAQTVAMSAAWMKWKLASVRSQRASHSQPKASLSPAVR